jgi:hypothetical protein
MNCPEPNATAIEENISVAPAESWGEKGVAREIALLEAHVRQDKIARIIDEALAATERVKNSVGLKGPSKEALVNIEDELRESYLDYAMSVIVGRALSNFNAIDVIRTLSRKGMSLFSRFAHGLSAAIAIHRLQRELLTFKSLRKVAEIACNRAPLFAYGPELSEFRHRLR